MWKNTTNFVRVQAFQNVESGPIEVAARELASTTINKSKYEEIRQRTARDATPLKVESALQCHHGDTGTSLPCTHDENMKQEENSIDTMDVEVARTVDGGTVRKPHGRAAKRAKSGGGGEGAKRPRVSG